MAALPEVALGYNGLTLAVKIPTQGAQGSGGFDTLAGKLLGAPHRLLQRIRAARGGESQTREVKLLDDISGVVLPGRMTLVLGAPGSGKSSYLKALTSRLANQNQLRGCIRYSGLTAGEAAARGIQLGQLVQYVSQLDEHSPLLTVRETLTFVARNSLAGVDGAGAERRVQEVLDLLHLHACADTIVGNDLLRGISGGEKKRVTVGEGLITNARFLALDEISTGLDASVTLKIVAALRSKAIEQRIGVVIALLQPTPEIVGLFDDIVLLRDGAEVFHGPRTELPGYLEGLGFFPPPETTLHGLGHSGSAGCGARVDAGASALADTNPTVGPNTADLADWVSEWITYPARRHHKDVELRGGDKSRVEHVNISSSGSEPPMSTDALVRAWKAHPLFARLFEPATGSVVSPVLALESDFARRQYSKRYVHNPLVHLGHVVHRQGRLLLRNFTFFG